MWTIRVPTHLVSRPLAEAASAEAAQIPKQVSSSCTVAPVDSAYRRDGFEKRNSAGVRI